MRETREIAAVEIITSDCVCVNKDNQVERMRDIIYIKLFLSVCCVYYLQGLWKDGKYN